MLADSKLEKICLKFLLILTLIGCTNSQIKVAGEVSSSGQNDNVGEQEQNDDTEFLMANSSFDSQDLIVTNVSSEVRAIALSHDKQYIYTCALNGIKEIYAYDRGNGALKYTYSYSASNRFCKSIDVHSSGTVYFSLSDSDEIGVASSDLSTVSILSLESIVGLTDTGNNDLDAQQVFVFENYLYLASDKLGRIYRLNLNSSNGAILSLDTTWGTAGYVQLKDDLGNNIDSSDELLSMVYDSERSSLFAVLEGVDVVIKIENQGSTQSFDVMDIPAGAAPHDIEILDEYFLVTYGASDGSQNKPVGIGVFNRSDLSYKTTLKDINNQLRNAQGIVVDEEDREFYVVDGFYGAPNDISLPRVSDSGNQNIILKFTYNQ